MRRYIGGDYEILYNGVELDAYRTATALTPTTGPTIFFCGRHEERKGSTCCWPQFESARAPTCALWVGSTGPDTAPSAREYADDHASELLGAARPTPTRWPGSAGADVFCAPSLHGESFGVVLIEAMAAGTAGRRQRRSTATATSPPTASTPCSCEPGDVDALRRCAAACAVRAGARARGLRDRQARRAPATSR